MRAVVAAPRNATLACAECGKRGGLLWESVYKTLDFGNGHIVESHTLGMPVRCDDCESASSRKARESGK